MKAIAELRLQLLRRGAKRKSAVHITIGAPQPDGDDWCCPIRLKGIVDDTDHRTFGVDSWQAIILALALAEIMIRNEVRNGGRLFYLGAETSVDELFATRVRESLRKSKRRGAG